MLDAARRTKDEQLFRRATEIALQARAGDQALSATCRLAPGAAGVDRTRCAIRSSCWSHSTASPTSRSRSRLLLRQTARPTLPAVIEAVPRFLARAATDRNATAVLVERMLLSVRRQTPTPRRRRSSRIGRAWLAANDSPRRSPSRSARAMPIRRRRAPRSSRSTCCRRRPTPRRSSSASSRRSRQLQRAAALRANARDLAASRRGGDRDRGPDPETSPTSLRPGSPSARSSSRCIVPKEATAALRNYVRLVEGGAAVTFGAAASARGAGGRRRGRHAVERKHRADPGVPSARAGRRAAAATSPAPSAGWRASTTRSARSRCRRGAPRCSHARAR